MKGPDKVSLYVRLNSKEGRPFKKLKESKNTYKVPSLGPTDVFVLRYGYQWEFVGPDLEQALKRMAVRIDILRREARGEVLATLPTNGTSNVSYRHSPAETLASYLAFLRSTTKRNGRRYNERSVKSREANILEFTTLIGKPFVEQYDRADMVLYKNKLYAEGKVNDTVLNKLMTVTTWLKHNQLVKITGLLQSEDWPIKRKTEPHPFRPNEVDAQMAVAGSDKLLLRFAHGTGMRKSEMAHAERSDIDICGHYIQVDNKPRYVWETKTLAGIRKIPLGDDLLRDLLALPEGLLFPSSTGRPDEHIDRRFEAVRDRAEVKPIPGEKSDPCHRWRDTYATDLVRSRKLELRDIARLMGHEDLQTMDLYAETVRMESPEARAAANAVDQHGEKRMAAAD